MKKSFVILVSLLSFTSSSFAGFEGFDFDDDPSKPVTHAGALLIKRYPQNSPDSMGDQVCMVVGHDCIFDCFAPPAGGVEKSKDFEMKEEKPYYSSLKTLIREVLEETGGLVKLSHATLENTPKLYSKKFHDLLAVVHDNTFSCMGLTRSVQQSCAARDKGAEWKEMDRYDVLPINNVLSVAKIMKTHFDKGGNINNLPNEILSPRKSNGNQTPLVWVETRLKTKVEFCAYYMGAIADTLSQFREILMQNNPDYNFVD